MTIELTTRNESSPGGVRMRRSTLETFLFVTLVALLVTPILLHPADCFA
jgi:hypothetical protein